jgi:hypothetical protein
MFGGHLHKLPNLNVGDIGKFGYGVFIEFRSLEAKKMNGVYLTH